MKPTELRPFILAEDAIHLDELWCHVEKLCGPETTAPEHLLLVRAT